MKPRRIILELTEEHAKIIMQACELWARIQMGQLGTIATDALMHLPTDRFIPLRERLESLSGLVTGLGGGASHAIRSPAIADHARVAMDIRDVIRHHLSWKRSPKGGIGVNFDKPSTMSTEEPLPLIIDKRDVMK